MQTLLGIALNNAVMALLLALLATAAGLLCRRPAITRALWLLVLLKLLTPPIWSIPIEITRPQPAPPSPAAPEAPAPVLSLSPTVTESSAEDSWHIDDEIPVTAGAPAMNKPLPPVAAPPPVPDSSRPVIGPTVIGAAIGIWLTGSVFCAVAIIGRTRRFARLLRYATSGPPAMQARLIALGERLGLSRVPGAWLVPGAVCPMLWGWLGRPRILVPSSLWGRLNDAQRSSLLAHELAHYARRDHWVRLLELVVIVLYWWFPVAWWARRRLREAEEQCCDAWVLWTLPGTGRDYASALLDAVDFMSDRTGRPLVPALASGMGQFHQLKRRLVMIKHAEVPRRMSWSGRAVMALAGLVLLPLAPTMAQVEPVGPPPSALPGQPAPPPVQPPPEDLFVGPAPVLPVVPGGPATSYPAPRPRPGAAPGGVAPAPAPGGVDFTPRPAGAPDKAELERARTDVAVLKQHLEAAMQRLADLERRAGINQGITSGDGKISFMPIAGGGIEAVDVASGRIIWRNADGSRPVAVQDTSLLAEQNDGGRIRIDIATGKTILRADANPAVARERNAAWARVIGARKAEPVPQEERLDALELRLENLLADLQKLKKERDEARKNNEPVNPREYPQPQAK